MRPRPSALPAALLILALAAPARAQGLDPHDPASWTRLAAAWLEAPEAQRPGLRRLAWELAASDPVAAEAFERGAGRTDGLAGLARSEAPAPPELSGRSRALERTLRALAPERPAETPARSLERLLLALEGERVEVGLGGPEWLEPHLLLAAGERADAALLAARDRVADEALGRWAAGGPVEAARAVFERLRSPQAPRPLVVGLGYELERAHAAGWRPPGLEEWDTLGQAERLELLGRALRLGVGRLPCPGGASPDRSRRPSVEDQLRRLGWQAVPLLVELSAGPGREAAARTLLLPYCRPSEASTEAWWARWSVRGPRAWWHQEALEGRLAFGLGSEAVERQWLEQLLPLAVADLGDGAPAVLLEKLPRFDARGRRYLVEAAAALDLPELAPLLEASLASDDPVVVGVAVRALEGRVSPAVADRVLDVAFTDTGEGAPARTLEAVTALLRLGHPEAAALAAHVARTDDARLRLVRRLAPHRARRDVRLVLLAVAVQALHGEERPVAELALAAATLLPPSRRPDDPSAALAGALASEAAPDLSGSERTTLRRAALLLGEDAQAPLLAAGYDVRAVLARDLVAFASDAGRDADGPGAWARRFVEVALRDGVAPVESRLRLATATCEAALPPGLTGQVQAQAGRAGVPGLLRLLDGFLADPGPVAGLELIVSRDGARLDLHVESLGLRVRGPTVEVELAGPGCDHSLRRVDGGSPVDAVRELLPAAVVELLAARGPEARVHLRVWR